MTLKTLFVTPEQAAELQAPFSVGEAKVAMMAGFAHAISQAGLLPSEADEFLSGQIGMGKMGFDWGSAAANLGVWMPLGLGALGGAYTAYARHDAKHDFDDRNQPELIALKQKLKTYRMMTDDLKRTNAVEGGSPVQQAAP